MLPRRFVPPTPLSGTKVKVYAANGTTIPVLGTTNFNFEVAGVPVYCHFLVSDANDEPMLGIDWLEANDCAWDFVRGTIRIAGKEVALKRVENWENAICKESVCSGVVTRGGAREQDHAEECHGDEVLDPTRISGRSGDPSLEAAPRHQDPPLFKSTPATSPLEEMSWSKVELQALQKQDADIGPVQLWLETGARPPREFLDCDSSELKSYWAQFDSFVLVEGVVYRKFVRPDGTNRYLQLLLPKSLPSTFSGDCACASYRSFCVQENVGPGAEEGLLELLENGCQAVLCMLQGL